MVSGYTLARKLGKTNCLTYVPKNINLSFSPLNATVVGSPTINSGVASGFSTSNYLIFNGTGTVSANNLNSFEILFKVITPTTWTSNGRVINPTNGADSTTAPYIEFKNSRANLVWFNGTTYIPCDIGITLSSNTTYWLKWVYDGSIVKGYYSTNGSDYIFSSTTTLPYKPYFNSTEMGIGCRVFDKYDVCVWNGSVDLKEAYIKVNGSIWWQGGTGALTLKAGSKVYVPNGFEDATYYKRNVTVVGSPTISNGAVSGFSSANYLKIDKTFSPGSSSWEISFQFATSGTFNDNKVIFDASSGSYSVVRAITIYITPSMKMAVGLSGTAGSSWTIKNETDVSNFTFAPNKVYVYKLSFNGSIYKGEVYDGESGTWTTDFTVASSSTVYSSSSLIIGQWIGFSASTGFASLIDISRSYIKINGSVWWQGVTESTDTDYDYVVDTIPKFDEIVVESDISYSEAHTSSVACYAVYSQTIKGILIISLTDPNFSYDSTINKIIHSYLSGINLSFPIALVHRDTTGIGSLDQIFDWCGYIGSTAFVLPGVKGLIPNGFNADGTYKSVEFTTDRVVLGTYANTLTTSGEPMLVGDSQGNITRIDYKNVYGENSWHYEKDENKWYYGTTQMFWAEIGSANWSSGKITSITPATVKTTDDFSRPLLNYNGTRYILKY